MTVDTGVDTREGVYMVAPNRIDLSDDTSLSMVKPSARSLVEPRILTGRKKPT